MLHWNNYFLVLVLTVLSSLFNLFSIRVCAIANLISSNFWPRFHIVVLEIPLSSLDFYFPFLFGLFVSIFKLVLNSSQLVLNSFYSIAVTFWISSKFLFKIAFSRHIKNPVLQSVSWGNGTEYYFLFYKRTKTNETIVKQN